MKTKKWLRAEIKRLRSALNNQTIFYQFKFAQTAVRLFNGQLEVIKEGQPIFREQVLGDIQLNNLSWESMPETPDVKVIEHRIQNLFTNLPVTHTGKAYLYLDTPLNEETK